MMLLALVLTKAVRPKPISSAVDILNRWLKMASCSKSMRFPIYALSSRKHMRGTAFGVYDVAIGIGTFVASAGAGALWVAGGASMTFWFSACVATAAAVMLSLRRLPRTTTRPYS